MLPIRTILHPSDFSAHSNYAAGLALALARDYGAQLIVLHVAQPPVVVYGEGIYLPEPENYQAELREQLRQVIPEDSHVTVEQCLVEGDAAREILRAAEESKCDLIVMGTHGRNGIGRLLMGSVAEHVQRKASCPVLTVRTPMRQAAAAEDPSGAQSVKPEEITS